MEEPARFLGVTFAAFKFKLNSHNGRCIVYLLNLKVSMPCFLCKYFRATFKSSDMDASDLEQSLQEVQEDNHSSTKSLVKFHPKPLVEKVWINYDYTARTNLHLKQPHHK